MTFEQITELASKHTRALRLFSEIFKNKKQKSKFKYIAPIKLAGFSRKQAELLHFYTNNWMWKHCIDPNKRNKGGRPAIDNNTIRKLNIHIEKNSTVASNRFLKNECAFYRHCAIKTEYETFSMKYKLSYSSFYKYMQKKYKKSHRLTDLCEYCELNKVFQL